jgi:chloride channel protein, CIC family
MTAQPVAAVHPGARPWAARAAGWLRASRGGLFAVALVVGAGAGLGAVGFRYLVFFLPG